MSQSSDVQADYFTELLRANVLAKSVTLLPNLRGCTLPVEQNVKKECRAMRVGYNVAGYHWLLNVTTPNHHPLHLANNPPL